jgi:hypothetical protein
VSAAKKSPNTLPSGLRRELDRQQTAVYETQAVVICIVKAMEAHFSDWPRSVPLFNYALRRVVAQLESVATALYDEELMTAMSVPEAPGPQDD